MGRPRVRIRTLKENLHAERSEKIHDLVTAGRDPDVEGALRLMAALPLPKEFLPKESKDEKLKSVAREK